MLDLPLHYRINKQKGRKTTILGGSANALRLLRLAHNDKKIVVMSVRGTIAMKQSYCSFHR